MNGIAQTSSRNGRGTRMFQQAVTMSRKPGRLNVSNTANKIDGIEDVLYTIS
jgi:hypothetical protein